MGTGFILKAWEPKFSSPAPMSELDVVVWSCTLAPVCEISGTGAEGFVGSPQTSKVSRQNSATLA